jgi:hypothetical protein
MENQYVRGIGNFLGSLLIIIIRDCPERSLAGSAPAERAETPRERERERGREAHARCREINPDDFSLNKIITRLLHFPDAPLGSFQMHFYGEDRKTPLTSLFFTLLCAGER